MGDTTSGQQGVQVDAHVQDVSHKYKVRYPAHGPRATDPHYRLFEAVKKKYKETAKCWYGTEIGDYSRCNGGLELHHWVIEFAVVNEVDPVLLDKSFPDAGATPDEIDTWVESHYADDGSGALIFLCEYHHRGTGGVHVVDFANWKASLYAPDLLD